MARRHSKRGDQKPGSTAEETSEKALSLSLLSNPQEHDKRFITHSKKLAGLAAAFVMLIGVLVLIGWLFDFHWLKGVYGDITMKANTALSLLLTGVSLFLLNVDGEKSPSRSVGQACAAIAGLVGVLTLSEHVFGWNVGIDQLLATEPAGALATASPGRMGLNASSCLTMSAIALLLLYARRRVILAQLLAIIVGLFSWLAIIGYTYQAQALYGIARYTGIALFTAVSFQVLSLGLLLARTDEGIISTISSDRAGSMMARRLLITAIVVPFLLGWLGLAAQRSGYYDVGFGTALLILAIIIIFTSVIWQSALKLNQTEQQHLAAEAALHEKEERLLRQAALIELSYEPIFVFDLDHGIVEWNKGCEQLYGYRREEAVGQVSDQLLNTKFPISFDDYRQTLIRDGYWSGELRHTTLDGRNVLVESRQQLIESQGKRFVLESNRDITESRLAEDRFRVAVESAPNSVVIIDHEGRILLVNSQTELLFGYSREELIGQPIEMLVPERFRRQHPEYRKGFAAEPKVRPMGAGRDLFGLRKDGSEVPIEIGLNPIAIEGKTMVLSSIVDISTRKRAEQEREHLLEREQNLRAEAERANQLKDEFLATVSHELRTPLNSILGWATMLRSGRLDEVNLPRALETIERNARAQAQLIEDLLDVSRVITGKFHLDVRPIELTSVIKAAVESARPSADAKSIQLQMLLEPAADHTTGDANRLQQVIWNLLSNAIKFTPKGGLVQVRLDRTDSNAQITVRDTGEGISPEFLPYVFDRFQQADGTKTRRHGGLGLGLAIVRHLVELHGGTIEARSEGLGRGASFVVRLPVVAMRRTGPLPPVQEEVSTRTVPSDLHGLRILATDDVADTRQMLKGVLEHYGAQVMTAASAKEALDLLSAWNPDVMVCDIGMPDEDGYSLIEKIRRLPPDQGRNTLAIALTGYVRVEERVRALAAGYNMFVPKPVEADELASIIAGLVGRTEQHLGA
jgi:PAS domain S-box-containing protein